MRTREDWPWGSLHRRYVRDREPQLPLAEGPEPWPDNWLALVNEPQTQDELDALRKCIRRGRPYGREPWVRAAARQMGLESTLRSRGRPRK